MAQDNHDKAREILVKYHGDGNPDSRIVALEMEEMMEVVSITGSDKTWWDFRDLFNTKGARYRTFLVVAVAWFSEIELPPTSYYLPLMGKQVYFLQRRASIKELMTNGTAKTIGITSVHTQLLLNALQTPIMMTASICGLCLIDKWGRRKFLITGSILMSVCLSIITACTAQHAGKPVVSGVGIAFLYIFLISFAFCWVSEILTYLTTGCIIADR